MGDKRSQIIKELKDAQKSPVSGEELGLKLGISRTMVWKYIKALKTDGYEIGSFPKRGYVLKSVPQFLYPAQSNSSRAEDSLFRGGEFYK